MNNQLKNYVESARSKGLQESEIKQRLLDVGWSAQDVYAVLEDDKELIPPSPPQSQSTSSVQPEKSDSSSSFNVVSGGFSGAGFEYFIYFVSLGIVALSIGALLHNLVNLLFQSDKYSFYGDVIPAASAALIVALPIMLVLMFRLHKKEQNKPEVLKDPSRRRAVQLLMLVTFVVGVIKLISYIYNIITIAESDVSLFSETLHAVITLGIAGGLFIRYWRIQSNIEE